MKTRGRSERKRGRCVIGFFSISFDQLTHSLLAAFFFFMDGWNSSNNQLVEPEYACMIICSLSQL